MSSDKHTQGILVRGTNTNSNDWMKVYCNGKPILRSLELSKVGARKSTDFEEEQANAERIVKAWNNYDQLLEALDGIGSLLEFAIHATPTGAVRNLLTDANVIAKAAIEKTKP